MKKHSVCTKVLSLLLAAITLMAVFIVPPKEVFAQALPTITPTAYIATYTYKSSGRVYAYTDSSLKKKDTGHYIDCPTDECYIVEVKGKAVRVSYPVSGNKRREGWFSREDFTYQDLAKDGCKLVFTSTAKVTTFKWKGSSITYGYIAKGDRCYLLRGDKTSDWLQVLYPVGSHYKMGWVKGADIRNIIWPVSKAANIAVTGVSINLTNITLSSIGATKQLSVSISPSNATNKNVTWTSSNSSVVTVTSTGLIKAIKNGSATITVTTKDGSKKASCSVIVNDPIKVYALFVNGFGADFAVKTNTSRVLSLAEMYSSIEKLYNNNLGTFNYKTCEFNAEAWGISKSTFEDSLSYLTKTNANDIAIVWLTTHGSKDGEFQLGLFESYKWSTMVDKLKAVKSNTIILVVSSCYAGTLIKAVKSLPESYRNRFIVFTSEDEEHETISYPGADFHPFFRAFNLGLTKKGSYYNADLNKNGEVTAKELYSYIYSYEKGMLLNLKGVDSYDPNPSFYAHYENKVIYR